jgi:hypothetical protein
MNPALYMVIESLSSPPILHGSDVNYTLNQMLNILLNPEYDVLLRINDRMTTKSIFDTILLIGDSTVKCNVVIRIIKYVESRYNIKLDVHPTGGSFIWKKANGKMYSNITKVEMEGGTSKLLQDMLKHELLTTLCINDTVKYVEPSSILTYKSNYNKQQENKRMKFIRERTVYKKKEDGPPRPVIDMKQASQIKKKETSPEQKVLSPKVLSPKALSPKVLSPKAQTPKVSRFRRLTNPDNGKDSPNKSRFKVSSPVIEKVEQNNVTKPISLDELMEMMNKA